MEITRHAKMGRHISPPLEGIQEGGSAIHLQVGEGGGQVQAVLVG